MPSETLKPCAHCGGEAEFHGPPRNPGRQWVACSNPECCVSTSTRCGRAEAIAAWNTRPDPLPEPARAQDAALVAERGELLAACKAIEAWWSERIQKELASNAQFPWAENAEWELFRPLRRAIAKAETPNG